MFIQITNIFVGIMIILIPFMLLFVLVKKFLSKDKEKENLELRVEILEHEIQRIKEHINYIDEL
ncbi:hypothetical protein HMPREF9630_01250 [Peptoanaerobacter stomatis]|uniref:Uncharacterized protein n=1 Tax=Peptoanaerobacter stomatis TaxID=796937 RepID=G9XB01_9FIRM|nr:hypothetical protein [Peptoanaerobacter stomatis]EHL17994.1 hypothetical protein HMPREF9630_01250 [Peptoanaerobacter stomatis]EHL19835.1 hypothetical protein HMPREF9628_01168 [Peptoanaerobacter stomatis]EJU24470.1 hypothetical protein HMPREF1143_1303 [Peptoanaerobacter stomatis]NWO25884.1 hypothetical protein [Peptostreptococcaceae bacterium oral taxon 081]